MKNIVILSFIFFQTTAFAKLYCNISNYKEFIYNKQKTDQLIKQTGKGCQLRYADLSRKNLAKAYLPKANLTGAQLQNTILERAQLPKAILIGANFNFSNSKGANFKGSHITPLSALSPASHWFRGTTFTRADLRDAILEDVNGWWVWFEETILERAHLKNAKFLDTLFDRVNMKGADCRNTNFGGSYFRETALNRVDLRGARFGLANVEKNVWIGALYNSRTNFPWLDSQFKPKKRGMIFKE